MKTALETTPRAATNTLQIATYIIESYQRYIFCFTQSPNHFIRLSREEKVFTARQRPIRIRLLLFLRSDQNIISNKIKQSSHFLWGLLFDPLHQRFKVGTVVGPGSVTCFCAMFSRKSRRHAFRQRRRITLR